MCHRSAYGMVVMMVVPSSLAPSFASSRPWTSILAYEPELDQRSCSGSQAVSGCSYSSDQILVCQPAAGRTINEAFQPLQRMPRDIAFVQPKSELVNVPAKVLRTDMMIGAVDAALLDGPNAFDAVRRDAIADEFSGAVVDGLVLKLQCSQPGVSAVLVGMQRRSRFDAGLDFCLERPNIRSRHYLYRCATAALPHAENRCFADRAAPSVKLLALVLVRLFAADVRLVNFDDAAQLVELVAACLAEPPEDEPSRLLGNADLLGELHRGDALACRNDEIHRIDPLMQRNMRPFEDRAGANGEILLAMIAAIVAALADSDPIAHAANGTKRTFGPKPAFEVHPCTLLVREHLEKLKGRNRALAHGLTHSSSRNYSAQERGSQVCKSFFSSAVLAAWSAGRLRLP